MLKLALNLGSLGLVTQKVLILLPKMGILEAIFEFGSLEFL